MSVFITIVAALTTAAIGLFGAGLLANACVRWYEVSSFEGGSGYFVVFVALIGGIAGFLVGLGVALACIVGDTRFDGWSACLVAWATAVAILVVATALAWLLAPPPAPEASIAPESPATVTAAAGSTGAPRIAADNEGPSPDERVVDDDPQRAARALRSLASRAIDPQRAIDILALAGGDLMERLSRVVATTAVDDPSYEGAADVSVRFSAWIEAMSTLRVAATAAVDDRLGPQLTRILNLSRMRPDSHVLRQDVCRVASHYAERWLGVPPAADDPAPRPDVT